MAEDSRGDPACGGMDGRKDPVPSSGGFNFPEYEFPELNTQAFHVAAFGELWRGRLRGEEDLSLKDLPGGREVTDSGCEDAAVARDLGCSLETAAELRAVSYHLLIFALGPSCPGHLVRNRRAYIHRMVR